MFNLGGEFPPHKSNKIMKKQGRNNYKTQIKTNPFYEGESLEQKIRKATTTKEPIESISAEIYTEKKDGVLPQYDIRTDRFDIALEAMNKAEKIRTAQREDIPNTEKNTEKNTETTKTE